MKNYWKKIIEWFGRGSHPEDDSPYFTLTITLEEYLKNLEKYRPLQIKNIVSVVETVANLE